ncbi:MAG: hypothetical protein AAGU27_28410 [Dehalobacterium sp.]
MARDIALERVILEVDGEGNEKARNVYGTNLLQRTDDGDSYYYMYNGHGDVTALIGTDGEIAATYYYDAFGNILESTGTSNNPLCFFTSNDKETGYYYLIPVNILRTGKMLYPEWLILILPGKH